MSDDDRDKASATIAAKLIRSHEFNAAKSIACYLPMYDEVDPSLVIERAWRAKKRVFAPVIDSRGGMSFRRLRPDTKLERNYFGLWEPIETAAIDPATIDLVATPLVAFDSNNNRIGMGGGYFDRCFSFLRHRVRWRHPKLVGLAFNCQKVENIEPNPWDIRLYQVISESD